jgi:hypothetical protein
MATIKTFTFLTNATWAFTGSSLGGTPTSSVSASFIAVGAGGHGSATGNGGSGGAFAQSLPILVKSGSVFVINVGQPTSTDGGTSSLAITGSIFALAAGGKRDGTVAHQAALTTGSYKVSYGGKGGADYKGYDSYEGAGGGASGGNLKDGTAGSSGFFSARDAGAPGGLCGNSGSAATGGVGAFYDAGSHKPGIMTATAGAFPGCGGGGGYDYGTDSSGAGAAGEVVVILQDW